MLIHIVRAYLRIGLFFYFKKIRVVNLKSVPKDKPVLFLCNHQNALLDALLIATKCGRFSYFLTRAAVFKKSFVSKLLRNLRMLPVYRIRDGWGTISNNNDVFAECSELLNGGEAIVIFPEGNHNLKRTVRPLSKGFTRIVFDTLEKYPNLDLQLVPIGLNFRNAEVFVDSTTMHFGKPISAKAYVFENRNEGVKVLKQTVFEAISSVTTHIYSKNYEDHLEKLKELHVDFLNPNEVNTCIATNFLDCKPKPKSKLKRLRLFFKLLLILSVFPVYLIWKFLMEPKIDEVEFVSTFRFIIAIILVPFFLLCMVIMLTLLVSFKIGILYLFTVLVLSLATVKL